MKYSEFSDMCGVWNWPFFLYNYDASWKPEIKELKLATMLEF